MQPGTASARGILDEVVGTMENFTPLSALVGGIMIGASASVLLLATGRIAGISGIAGGLVPPVASDALWRLLFLGGLVAGVLAWRVMRPGDLAPTFDASLPVIVLGGLLVGFGTRVGGGCTSGHGVCGLGRRSPRSAAATAIFMAAAGATVFAVRHVVRPLQHRRQHLSDSAARCRAAQVEGGRPRCH